MFWLTDFFSTFVRNLNFNNLIGLTVWAGRATNTSTAASPTVVCNYGKTITTQFTFYFIGFVR
jgi:hypothetical protein